VTLTVYRGGQYIEVELTFDTQPQTTGSDDSSQSSDNSYGYGNGGQMPDNWQEFYNYFFGNRG
jgi:serine protease Do